jgi:hypothetical protein
VVDDKDTVERAKELLVYGPLGFAMYLRDTAPSFLKVFVARGRAEFEQRRRSVGDQLGQVRDVGANTAEGTGPQVFRLVSDGLTRVRETAEGALGALGGLSADLTGVVTTPAGRGEATPASTPSAPATAETSESSETGESAEFGQSAETGATADTSPDPGLALADYDALSASQVVDRLDGLGRGDLEAIRRHEVAHRGRATILGKIDQLTRGD